LRKFSPSDHKFPVKNQVEDAKKKKKKKKKKKTKPVNKKEFQSRSQEKNIRNVPETEKKLVYRQKNKSYVEDSINFDVNMKKLVKCKSSKSQTRKRQVLLRTSSI
jgi:hypothetical protein